MVIFNGKKIAERIILDLKKKIKKERVNPKLAVISVGKNLASELFIRNKKRAAKKIGVVISLFRFKESSKEREIIKKIEELNKDFSVHSIIVQLPLPKGFAADKIIDKINPQKDADGFHRQNLELLKKGKTPYFFPVFPSAILVALKKAVKSFRNKRIAALVNSEIFGETLKIFLARNGIKIKYFFSPKPQLKKADIVISALGRPGLIRGDMIKEKAVLIDAGIVLLKNKRAAGDIDRKGVKNRASFLTPVPGGIGPLTVALLLKNVYLAAKYYGHRQIN